MAFDLKPFVINLNDLGFLLAQVNFQPMFDAQGNAVVDWDGVTTVYDGKGNAYDTTGMTPEQAWETYGHGFPSVSAPIGVRDVTGFHNNLFGTQAQWGAVDVPFRRDIPADFDNYVTSPGANYATTVDANGVLQVSVIDMMPRIISQTITTAGVNLLKDGSGHFVEWDAVRYTSDAGYAALIDASGVDIAHLVEGAKIVAPLTTEIAVLDANGDALVWSAAQYQASMAYTVAIATFSNLSFGGLFGTAAGGALIDGGPIFYQPSPGIYQQIFGQTWQPDLLAYKQLVDALHPDFTTLVDGEAFTTTLTSSGYGLLEQLGHIDFQNPGSGEFFIGSENPGVAPVNSWFAIFGQFFDHGLDFIDKGGQGTKVVIELDPGDPLYRAPGTDGPLDRGVTSITVTRATVSGENANGDPNYVNHTSPFIDQSQTYGSHEQITSILRAWVTADGGATFQAGIELFDGQTLADSWTRRWPDGTSQEVHDTLPTLNELRQHLIDTGRDDLTWEDVTNLRNRDLATGDVIADGEAGAGLSGHALLLDMNPRFNIGRLNPDDADATTSWDASVNAKVTAAIATLNGNDRGDVLSFDANGNLQLTLGSDFPMGPSSVPAGTVLTGASALMPWVDFATFSVMQTQPGTNTAFTPDVRAAVGEILMASVGDHYLAGDGRVNENFGLTSIHHVFHEEHNYQVANLKNWIYAHDANNPGASDVHEQLHNWQTNTGTLDANGNYLNADGSIAWDLDKMFEATKLIVEMEYQHAAVDQYARTVTPRIQEFVGYSSGVDATVSLEYAQVAFRFGHSTIRETIDAIDPDGWMFGHVTRYALEKAFLAPETFAEKGVAAITLGLTRQQMNEVDEFVTPALNQGLLDQPLDLPAINIARGRDLGIPTLNDFREALSLARYTSWSDFGTGMQHGESLVNFIAAYSFGGDAAKAQAILDLAGGLTPAETFGFTSGEAIAFLTNTASGNAELDAARDGFNHIDSWIGGLAEVHVPGGLLGETFDAVFVAQIQSLMDGDRFYYLYRLFGTQIHEEINNGQFKDLVERNTGLSHLNGSIFAYADKYYDFNRNADGALPDALNGAAATGDHANHFYADLLAGGTRGIFSDGGASTSVNGTDISVVASDFIRSDVTLNLIRDARPELDPAQVHTVEGTPTSGADSHEVIVATEFSDYIHARSGDDTVYGEGGDDYIYGDGGVDRLYGGAGNDMIDAGEGPDLADGGAGKDIIYGRGSGSEVGGFDQLVGGSGNDLVIGGEGIDKLSSGSGDDIVFGDGLTNPEMGNTDPFTHGGDGNDYIDGGASGDLLHGEEGDDYIVGGNDQDLMTGDRGDDILRPGQPSQAINGGPAEVIGDDGYVNSGFDLMDLSAYAPAAKGETIDLSTQANPLPAIDGTTPFPAWFQIEGAIGTRNDDTFVGDSAGDATASLSLGNNWLIGGSGNDFFTGNGGDDLIIGGSIRLDELIGRYADAANASGPGNLVMGSAEWIADAMRIGSEGFTGADDGYDNDVEDGYTGASNRASGALDGTGFLDAVGFDKHFTEMLRSRMFKDLVLGDGGADGAADSAAFSGELFNYTLTALDRNGDAVTAPRLDWNAVFAIKVVDNRAPGGVDADGNAILVDGTDVLIGVEQIEFAGQLVDLSAYFDRAPVLTLQGGTANYATTYTEQLTAASIAAMPLISDADDAAIASARIVLRDAVAGDELTVGTLPAGITAQIDTTLPGSITVTLTGTASHADYQSAIEAISFSSPSDDPTTADRHVEVSVSDGFKDSAVATATISVVPVDDPTLAGDDFIVTNYGSATFRVADWMLTANDTDPDTTLTLSGVNGASSLTVNHTANSQTAITDGGTPGGSFRYFMNGSGIGANSAARPTVTVTQDAQGPLDGDGNDNIVIGNGAGSTLRGLDGDDILVGGAGADTVNGGSGNDTLVWNANVNGPTDGRDVINGGADTDTFAVYGNNQAETYRIYTRSDWLAAGNNNSGQINAGTEIIVTRNGQGNGAIIAELSAVEEIVINTGQGNDRVIASGNFDTTHLAYNTITINDGGGDDVVDISALTSPHRIVFNTGGGYDRIAGDLRPQDLVDVRLNGTRDADWIVGGDDDDLIEGGDGEDRLKGSDGDDEVHGGGGDDWIVADKGFDDVDGGEGSDTYNAAWSDGHMVVNLSANRAYGSPIGLDRVVNIENAITGGGDDILVGNSEDNILRGGSDDDTIYGLGGRDFIDGGAGDDTLSGGGGADWFQFAPGFGNDVITGFDANPAGGQDKIIVAPLGVTRATFEERVSIIDEGEDTRIAIDDTSSILLKNVDHQLVTINDFVLYT